MSIINSNCVFELNKHWKTDFSPNVALHEKDDGIPPSFQRDNYEFGKMVAKINDFIAEGKRVCLFVGKPAAQPLPENNENEVWVSADKLIVFDIYREVKPDRMHLWIDCNQQAAIETLTGLFDRIVVDTSTIKFLNDDFARRFAVMLRNDTSSLIFESKTGVVGYRDKVAFDPNTYHLTLCLKDYGNDLMQQKFLMDQYYTQSSQLNCKWDFDEFQKSISSNFLKLLHKDPSKLEDLKKAFSNHHLKKIGVISYSDRCIQWSEKKLESHLKQIYNHVEFHDQEPFPYPERYKKLGYFVVSGFKRD